MIAEISKKHEGMARAENAAPDWFKEDVRDAIAYLADDGIEFCADDVRQQLIDWGYDSIDWPLALGGAFARAARLSQIKRSGGFRQTEVEGGHARSLALWVAV